MNIDTIIKSVKKYFSPTPAKDSVGPDLGRVKRFGGVILFLFFGVLGSFSAFVPLSTSSVASGTVIVDSKRKTIQHLEGGIVETIHVRDGDLVGRGALLISLDGTQANANRGIIMDRLDAAHGQLARLEAEMKGEPTITFPEELLNRADEVSVAAVLEGERRVLRARLENVAAQTSILNQRIEQIKEEITGLEAEISSEDDQLMLISDEIADVEGLMEKGLARKPRVLELKRQKAEISGSRSKNLSNIARGRQSIGETRMRISELRTEWLSEVVNMLVETRSNIYDLAENKNAADDIVARTEIRSPLEGEVVGLQVFTTGGVIGPGQPLMDIVPKGDDLIIEAMVLLDDIDVVVVGMPVHVHFTAYSGRKVVPVKGTVTAISGDRLFDEERKISYFNARIHLNEDAVKEQQDLRVYPGMSTEVIFVTGERTLLSYLLEPLSDSMRRSLRN
ncbi:MAG: HlyD family type I secretion periplasmic adaptor subunit [Sphingomonadales bacterium]|nr:HlyD family type I secretion periplasmic adaptor subunit [Sphingomonadales bacterium]